jgi:hypothetical protein
MTGNGTYDDRLIGVVAINSDVPSANLDSNKSLLKDDA